MKFLFAFISYADVTKDTNMYSLLVHELANSGHEVRVIAPIYQGKTRVRNEGGVSVLRVRSGALFNTNLVTKVTNTMMISSKFSSALNVFWPDWNSDWAIGATPPITLLPFFEKIKTRNNSKIYLILRDIFPQNAKDLGVIRNPLVFRYFRSQERKLYGISNIIGCMSPQNIEFVLKQNPELQNSTSESHLKLFPNWINPTHQNSLIGSDSIKRKLGLDDKLVAVFGGNFGKPQKVEFILDLAVKARHLGDVVFCLIGSGTEKNRIKRLAREMNLTNVMIMDRLPREEYQSMIRSADIGLVNLSEKFSIPNIPSRTLAYWDASLPVLAAVDKNTDLGEAFIKKFNAGLTVETGNLEQYYSAFLKLYKNHDLRREMGFNGRRAVEEEFTPQHAARRFLNHIESYSS